MAEYLIQGETLTAIGEAIRGKTGKTDLISPADMPAEIAGITTGSGGSSDDVRYVTFLSEDGSTVYGVKPVAVGDDCADPIARGLFDTPTKESTAQYRYTHYGWATEPNGARDANALKSVTENRNIYAVFIAAVRYYTISFYDGETLLTTQSLAYGSNPSYTPKKEGYTFTGWAPALAAVTGDAAYYAGWIEKLDFASLTWAEISAYCKSGNAAELFEIGATKNFTYSVYGNSAISATAQIVGFYHDDLADGTGKAPITLRLINFLQGSMSWAAVGSSTRNKVTWGACDIRKNLQELNGSGTYGLPAALAAVVKNVKKTYYDIPNSQYATSEDSIFLPSMSELGFEIDGLNEGACYEAFTSGKTIGQTYEDVVYTNKSGAACPYWTRTKRDSNGYVYAITASGTDTYANQGSSTGPHAVGYICIG